MSAGNKILYYYSAAAERVACVLPGWSTKTRQLQCEVLVSQGYKLVPDYKPLESQQPFAIVSAKFTDAGDHYDFEIVECALPVPISQAKLIAHPAIAPKLEQFQDIMAANTALAEWWAHEMIYLRGSPLAVAAQTAFGLTRDELETIVLACRP